MLEHSTTIPCECDELDCDRALEIVVNGAWNAPTTKAVLIMHGHGSEVSVPLTASMIASLQLTLAPHGYES